MKGGLLNSPGQYLTSLQCCFFYSLLLGEAQGRELSIRVCGYYSEAFVRELTTRSQVAINDVHGSCWAWVHQGTEDVSCILP